MFDTIKELISTRGVQLFARYGATALIALGAKASVTVDANDAAAVAKVAGAFLVASIFWVIDHYSHAQQKKDDSAT
jgi:hypothetical protein